MYHSHKIILNGFKQFISVSNHSLEVVKLEFHYADIRIALFNFPETRVANISLVGDTGVREDLQQALWKVNIQYAKFKSVDVFNKIKIC